MFWVRAIDLKGRHSDQPANVGVQFGGRRFNQTGVADLSTQLRSSLDQFPGVKLIPFGWVAFFIFLYVLLIGPGDYLLLRKVFGRMELTWITFPAIVLSVSLAAYCAAYFLKGNDLLINKVDVVDVDQVTGLTRGSTFLNLFSPQNRDYTLGAIPAPLDREGDHGTAVAHHLDASDGALEPTHMEGLIGHVVDSSRGPRHRLAGIGHGVDRPVRGAPGRSLG